MTVPSFRKLHVARHGGVATVTIASPPVNVLDVALATELHRLLRTLREDDATKVIVFESANPDFFIAHVDMTLIDDPHAFDDLAGEAPPGLNAFQALGEVLRAQPQITIVKLAGLARGGGAEFVAAADMTFAARGRAGLSQNEALMAIIPGGGATQYLASRVTRGRALEIVLGADLIDADTAERYGWINRALPAEELDAFVVQLARNIAGLSDGVVAAAKAAMPPVDLRDGFLREHEAWAGLFARPAAEQLIRGGLAAGAQTPEVEKNFEQTMRGVSKKLGISR